MCKSQATARYTLDAKLYQSSMTQFGSLIFRNSIAGLMCITPAWLMSYSRLTDTSLLVGDFAEIEGNTIYLLVSFAVLISGYCA